MPKFRVKPGFTHGAQKQYTAGDIVELTEEEAAGFMDKLEPARGKKAQEPSTLQQAILDATDADLDGFPGNVEQLRAWARGEKVEATNVVEGGLVVNPAPETKAEAVKEVEQELEAETGTEFVKTGDNPPSLAEADSKPIGRSRR